MRTFSQLFTAALLCSATLPMQAAGLPGAETVTPAEIATADRPVASREAAQTPRAEEVSTAEAIAAQTAAPQTAPVAVGTVSNARVSFAPTDGARFRRELSSQSTHSSNDTVLGVAEIRTVVDERWEKSGEQWLLHCTPVEVSVDYGSTPPAGVVEIREVLLSQPYTVVFNKQGDLVEVRGFDNAAAQIQEVLGDKATLDADENFNANQRKVVAMSPNYQFNWLFGKQWRLGQTHERDLMELLDSPTADRLEQVNTIAAIDPSVLILNFENNGLVANAGAGIPLTVSEKGTVVLDSASGQLRQLQKTHLGELSVPGANGKPVAHKRSEVISINWTAVE